MGQRDHLVLPVHLTYCHEQDVVLRISLKEVIWKLGQHHTGKLLVPEEVGHNVPLELNGEGVQRVWDGVRH